MESKSWLDRNLKFGFASPIFLFFFSKLSTSRSQFVGQILNSDLASSYFPFNTPTVFVFLPVLHPNRSFEISMTIVLILQQGLSESSRSRVSLLHSAQCNVFVFVFVYLSFFPFCFCLGRRSSLERLLSNSRVAFDHQNRHHHHQMNIRTQTRGKTSLGVLHANTRHKYANTKTIDRTR